MATSSDTRSRLRLLVIQALVFSLFATLFVRLYYLQVVSGADYQTQAAAQSVREVVVQPQRGLIVDAQGRPLVTNRMSWVISVDRTLLGKMPERRQDALLERIGAAVDLSPARIRKQLVTCGDAGSVPGVCWNGSPYQPVPIARDVRERVALRVLEQPEDHPAVVAEQQTVRAYPHPYGINAAHVLGYLSPITEGEYDRARADGDRSVNGASSVGRAGDREAVRLLAARHARLPPGRGRLDGPGARRGERDPRPAGRHPGHLDRRQGAGHRREAARPDHRDRPHDARHRDRPQLRRRRRRRRGDGGRHRPHRRDGQPADVRPRGVGRRHHQEPARPALLGGGRDAAARPRHPGAVRARVDLEAVHDRRGADQRLHHRHPAQLLLRVPGRQPGVQELRVRRLRLHRLRQGARGLLQHVLLPGRLRLLAAVRLRRRRRQRARPARRGGPDLRLRRRDRHRPAGRGLRADRRPEVEARLLAADEGLLLRHRRQAAGRRDERLRLHVRRASSASRASPTGPATRSTSRSARATPS